jgi:signal transduction histidine kinase/DNA-binding response OmpR family regulator/ligand-binding sensor domain-containing protein
MTKRAAAFRAAITWGVILVGCRSPAGATGPAAPGPGALRFAVREWGVADGLPGAHVNGVAQDRDGSLWIATLTGLLHFDGFELEVFDEASGDLPTSRITYVEIGPSGRLWVGTEQGHVLGHRDGAFHQLGELPYAGGRVATMSEDARGTLWVARYGDPQRPDQPLLWQLPPDATFASGLVAREDLDPWWIGADPRGGWGVVRHDGSILPAPLKLRAVALSRDSVGDVWGFMPEGRMVRLRDGLSDPFGEASLAVTESRGTLGTRVDRELIELFDPVSKVSLGTLPLGTDALWLRDRRGLLWMTEHQGDTLFALRGDGGGPLATIPVDSIVREIVEDREGNLWVSTMTRGLQRISESAVHTLGPEDGVPLPSAVGLTPSGEIFVAPAPAGPCFPLTVIHDGGPRPMPGVCGWMLWDRVGAFWFLQQGEVVVRFADEEVRLRVDAHWIAEDPERDGVVWIVGPLELSRAEARGGKVEITGTWPIVANRALAADGTGGVWIGGPSGLWHVVADRVEHYDRDDGLPVDNVRAILSDGRGGLWLGTYGGGLVHFDGQRFAMVGVDRGLPEPIVSSLVEDELGGLWFAGNRGIHRVRRGELEQTLADPQARVQVLSFGREQGLTNPETTGPPPVVDRDGRLWFPTFGGLIGIDPQVVARRESWAPIVSVRGPSSVEIAPSAPRNLDLAYTASHLSAPETLEFRYRLEPYDADWIDAGGLRSATYRNLPAGRFSFRVQARHSGGAWVEASELRSIHVRPKFRETGWFVVVLALGASASLALLWRLSTRQIRRRAAELERAVAERTEALAAERDVVARQAARLGELAEARSQFMAAISHELRTPLTLILGPLEDLRDQRLGAISPEAHREIDTTLRSADRLRRLVDRLLGVARSEVALKRLQCRETDLAATLERLVAELEPLATRRGSVLELMPVPRGLEVWVDELQFETVVINLVANAIKHTPAGSRVEVSVEHLDAAEITPFTVGTNPGEGADEARPQQRQAPIRTTDNGQRTTALSGQVELVVADDGPGIPASEIPYLFERFYRGRSASRDDRGGFGLGLALVREVVERHGGWIRAESGAAGTRFVVRLPLGCEHLAAEDLAPFDEHGAQQQSPELAQAVDLDDVPFALPVSQTADSLEPEDPDRTTILVVDDNADLRRLVRRQLEPTYRVDEAEDGVAALAAISRRLPDLVLSDVMMPELDGYGLCRALRADPNFDFVPVVLLTAKASADARVEGLSEGADAYLAKPFNGKVLRATVTGLLRSRRRLRDRLAAQAGASPPASSPAPDSVVDPADRAYLERLENAIANSLHDEDFSVDELGRLVFQSRVSLFRHVKRLLGTSPSELIRERRLERARRLLEAKEGTVSEVAYAVGFKSASHFSNSYLERFGVRPSALAGAAVVAEN